MRGTTKNCANCGESENGKHGAWLCEDCQDEINENMSGLRHQLAAVTAERDALLAKNTRLIEALESIDDADTLDIAQALAQAARYADAGGAA